MLFYDASEDPRAIRLRARHNKKMKPKSKPKYTTSPPPPSATLGLATDARGRILIGSETARSLSIEAQLTIILFALAGHRYVADPAVFREMYQRVAHLLDQEKGGIRADVSHVYNSPEAIAASHAQQDRIHEHEVQQTCSPVFVGGFDLRTTAAEIADLLGAWDVQHVHIGHSAGKVWAKAYLLPKEAEAACEYYENHDGVIRGRKLRITKSISSTRNSSAPAPAGGKDAP